MRFRRLSVALLVSIVSSQAAARAQVTTAVISGTVRDQTGAVLPGATVTVKNVETGVTRAAASDSEGRYRARDLSVGHYEVRLELMGFKATVRRGIELTVGREAIADFSLALGDLAEELVVTGEVALVDTRSGALSGVVTEDRIKELPLNGRDITQLMTLEPGVVQVRAGGPGATSGFGVRMSIAGARPDMIGWLLDGTDINSTYKTGPAAASGAQLGVEAVREFQVLTNSYSAEYGAAGGVVNSVTKSGSNALHGSLFEFHRNSALDARGFFDPGASPPPFRRNQFGFSAGGPIVRNRTFFFGAYEGLREALHSTTFGNVPTAGARNGLLPGRPPITIDPEVNRILALYPLPNGRDFGNGAGEYVSTVANPTVENFGSVRLDQTFNSKWSLAGRYTMTRAKKSTQDSLGLLENVGRSRHQYATVEANHILGAHWLAKIRFGYNRSLDGDLYEPLRDIGPLLRTPQPYPGSFNVPTLTALGPAVTRPASFLLNQTEWTGDVSYSSGAHDVKFGALARHIRLHQNQQTRIGGEWNFTSLEELLAGRVDFFTGVLQGTDGLRDFYQNLFGFYGQDSWKVMPRLTLNLGLRYEFITVPVEVNGKSGWVRFPTDPQSTIGPPFDNPSYKNLAPRASFAWDLFGDGKTSVRGGSGMFYDQLLPRYWTSQATKQPPFLRRGELRGNPPLVNTYQEFFNAANPIREEIWSLNYDVQTPYLIQYNLNVQHQISSTLMTQIGYSGSRGVHLVRAGEADTTVPVIQPDGQKFFPVDAPQRNPNFASDRRSTSDGMSFYNALLLGLTKRVAGGSQFQASYTWGKSIDEGSSTIQAALGGSGSYLAVDFYDHLRSRGLALFDVRHNFVVNYIWQLPGAGLGGVAGALAGGWQLGGVFSLQTGLSQTPNLSFTNSRNGTTSNRSEVPSLKPGASNNPVLGGPDRYFDASVFVLGPPGFYGNLGRGTLIGPGFATVDLSLVKNVQAFGASRMQFRAEGFNILNRANFGLPNVTSVLQRNGTPNPAAGRITSTSTTARQIQLGLKFLW